MCHVTVILSYVITVSLAPLISTENLPVWACIRDLSILRYIYTPSLPSHHHWFRLAVWVRSCQLFSLGDCVLKPRGIDYERQEAVPWLIDRWLIWLIQPPPKCATFNVLGCVVPRYETSLRGTQCCVASWWESTLANYCLAHYHSVAFTIWSYGYSQECGIWYLQSHNVEWVDI